MTVVASGRAPAFNSAVTATAVAPESSETDAGATDSTTDVDAVSSSLRVSSAASTVTPAALPRTVIVSEPSADPSFVGVKVNVPVPWPAPPGITSAKSRTWS